MEELFVFAGLPFFGFAVFECAESELLPDFAGGFGDEWIEEERDYADGLRPVVEEDVYPVVFPASSFFAAISQGFVTGDIAIHPRDFLPNPLQGNPIQMSYEEHRRQSLSLSRLIEWAARSFQRFRN